MSRDKKCSPDSQGAHQTPPAISHLMRREIQAPIAACLIREFMKVFGYEKAMDAATAAIRADALTAGRMMADKFGGNTLKELGRIVREMWSEDDAIVISMLEESDKLLSFDVTRCRYVELYDRMGMRELGYCLSCSRDESFARGFNPRIRLLRTQTIMQGAPHCDFRFILD
jgi:L-2-amino-thiazoline-4-carboxylic acid hydrolase